MTYYHQDSSEIKTLAVHIIQKYRCYTVIVMLHKLVKTTYFWQSFFFIYNSAWGNKMNDASTNVPSNHMRLFETKIAWYAWIDSYLNCCLYRCGMESKCTAGCTWEYWHFSHYPMAFVLDGSSKHEAHVWSKIENFIPFLYLKAVI